MSPQCPSPHHPTTIEPSIHPITVVHHHTIPPPSSLLSIPSLLSIEPSIHPTIVVRHLASMTNQKRLSFARSVLSKAMAPLWPRGSGSAERRRLEQARCRFMLRHLSAADLELVDQKTVPACWSPELVRESWAAPVGACDSKHLFQQSARDVWHKHQSRDLCLRQEEEREWERLVNGPIQESKLTPLAPLGGEIPHLCEPANVFDAVAPLGG